MSAGAPFNRSPTHLAFFCGSSARAAFPSSLKNPSEQRSPWSRKPGVLLYNPRYRTRSNLGHPDHSWVEVARWSAMCRRETGGPYCEGLTESVRTINGFRSNDPWAAVPRPYGCWYFVAPGTGVSVNIGRSLTFDSRQHASDSLIQ